jgi:type III secretion protein U
MAQENGEKKHPASQYKLSQLRRREGQVARSKDFPATISLIITILYLLLNWRTQVDMLQRLFEPMAFVSRSRFGDAAAPALRHSADLMLSLAWPPLLIASFTYIIASLIDSKGLVMSAKHVTPNFTRLNPASNFKNVFGLQALVQLGKTLLKAVLFTAVVLGLIWYGLNSAVWAPVCGQVCAQEVSIKIIVAIIIAALIIMLIVALADILISRAVFKSENRMTDQEVKQERKEQSGDPEMIRERRRLRNEAARQGGYRGLGNATVLVEAADGAVGIAYVQGKIDTPVVVLKVTGEAYRKLRFEAEGKGVPIVNDEVLLDSLMKAGRVGEPIATALFQPVARMLVKAGLHKV